MCALTTKADLPILSGMDTMQTLRANLDRARGRWKQVAADTGINYFTIARIARGNTPNPQIGTVDKLQQWAAKNLPVETESAA